MTVIRPGQRSIHIPGIGITTSRRRVSAVSSSETVVLNPIKDTLLDGSRPTWNFGATEPMGTWASTIDYKYLFSFDLSSISGSSCSAATFSLVTLNVRTSNRTLTLYQMASANEDWPEGETNMNTAVSGDCSWNDKDAGPPTAWAGSAGCSTAGTDFINTSLGVLTYIANTPSGTRISVALNASGLTALATAFGSSSFTLIGIPAGFTVGWYTRTATASVRPELEIVYS